MTTPTLTTAALQQTDGAAQEITVDGMTAWLSSVNGYRVSNAGKRRLFTADETEIISTSRRAVTE